VTAGLRSFVSPPAPKKKGVDTSDEKKEVRMKKNGQTPRDSREKGNPPQPSPFSNSRVL
jgi:hypothetical protein